MKKHEETTNNNHHNLIFLSICAFASVQVKALATATVPAPSLAPSGSTTAGTVVSLSVTVSGLGVTPTGTVSFQVNIAGGGWNTIGSGTLNSGGSASTTYTPSTAGSYQFQALYSGDTNYNPASSIAPASLTVNQASATVGAATFSPGGPITFGGFVTVSASVTGISGVPTPTGSVQFQVSINSGSYANFGSTVPLSGSSASTPYTPSSATTYNFEVVYQGDSNYVSGTTGAPSATLTVNKAAPTVSVPALNPSNTIIYGNSVTSSVTVSGVSGLAIPTGTVQFQYSTNSGSSWTNLGSTATLSGGSAASTSYTPTAPGSTYQFRVFSYSGDNNYNPVSTPTSAVTLNVNPATPTTGTTLSQSSRTLGLSITDTATVSTAGSGTTPTGSVTFQVSTDGGNTFNQYGIVKSLSSGSATSDAYTATGVGTFYFRAVYGGDANYASSQSGNTAEPLAVTQATATVGAASFTPASPITLGSPITVSASVTGPGGVTAPTGNVQFQVSISSGAYANFGSVVALSGSTASISYTPSTATTYNFRAVYQGDSNYVSGTTGGASGTLTVSAPLSVSVSPSSWTMDVSQSKPFTATASGGSGTYTSYTWYVGGSPQSSQTTSTFNYSPGTAGSYSITATVTDSSGSTSAQSTAVTVTVAASPTVSITPTGPISMDVGQIQAFTATPNGGTGTPSYQWYLDGSTVGSNSITYSYTASGTSHSITCKVTDSASTPFTSPASNAASVTVAASPTVSITPIGPITMDAGQVQPFSATASGGSGALSYQWYLDGAAVSGATSASYSYTAAGSSHSVTCKVTDHASTPVTSLASNAVAVTVNAALVAPTVFVSAGTINQGQTSSLTSAAVTTGTAPYQYQWFEKAPSGSFSAQGSNSTSFNFVTSGSTATGTWSFYLRVTDSLGAAVNSATVSVIVDSPSTSHFIFTSIGPQTAGKSFSITITAKGASNNTLTNYVGTNALTVSIGTINPASTTAFVAGVWTGSVTMSGAGSSIQISTTGSGMSGTSGTFTVNPGVLDHFSFSTISAQTAGSAFSVAVTAQDAYNNTVTSYSGTPSLTYSAGSISPTTMTAFASGVGSTSVTVTAAGSGATITATDGTHTGTSNPFTVTLTPTPTPTSSSSPTTTPTPTPTLMPGTTPTPTPKPSPTPTPSLNTITATTDTGSTVNLPISGNVTKSQISNAAITSDTSAKTITVSFTITGTTGTSGFCNMTIPKNAVSHGTSPVVYVDGVQASNQGNTQDANNFYIWFTTSFTTHQMKIQFTASSTSSALSLGPVLIVGITVTEIVLVFTVIAVRRLRRKPDSA